MHLSSPCWCFKASGNLQHLQSLDTAEKEEEESGSKKTNKQTKKKSKCKTRCLKCGSNDNHNGDDILSYLVMVGWYNVDCLVDILVMTLWYYGDVWMIKWWCLYDNSQLRRRVSRLTTGWVWLLLFPCKILLFYYY